LAARLRARDRARKGPGALAVARYTLGRVLQVLGLLITGVAMTAYFGTHSPTYMLRMMLVGVLVFIPGWVLARKPPA
jgi:hypothetical protein